MTMNRTQMHFTMSVMSFLQVGCFVYVVTFLICTSEGDPCDASGNFLPPFAPPAHQPAETSSSNTNRWHPFANRIEFDFVNYHFAKCQHSEGEINEALDMWTAQQLANGKRAAWANAQELYNTIDTIQEGDAPWKLFKIRYQGPLPPGTPPKWMTEEYELCARDTRTVLHLQLGSAHFKDQVHYVPYRQFNGKRQRIWSNLMSADWAWNQAVCTFSRYAYHTLTFCFRILLHKTPQPTVQAFYLL